VGLCTISRVLPALGQPRLQLAGLAAPPVCSDVRQELCHAACAGSSNQALLPANIPWGSLPQSCVLLRALRASTLSGVLTLVVATGLSRNPLMLL